MTNRPVHQLVHTLSYGDAISTEVMALRDCFREFGVASDIYSINTHPRLKGQALDYREFPKDFDGRVLLHYSLGSPLNDLYRSLNKAERTLIYHNLTPPEWFERVNPRVVADIKRGITELPELCRLSQRILADSAFNAGELTRYGVRAEVLELCVSPTRWNVETNHGIRSLMAARGGIHVLHVGRLAPNKCIEDIIKSFFYLHHYVEPKSTLWLSGIDIDTELYSFALKRLVRELLLEDAVHFLGLMADEELRALYEGASAYLCMSEHEGFCLPVIEAMSFGLPVIAYASSAVVDTVGSGGILVREKRHPEIAELMYEVATNTELRTKLQIAGRRRVENLSYQHFQARVGELYDLHHRA
ncbi:MAG: glycosyltransferase [Bdellovibrionota bacterium]|nr:MAG: glycosyltransferase [Bdellovibrionota bacterium]